MRSFGFPILYGMLVKYVISPFSVVYLCSPRTFIPFIVFIFWWRGMFWLCFKSTCLFCFLILMDTFPSMFCMRCCFRSLRSFIISLMRLLRCSLYLLAAREVSFPSFRGMFFKCCIPPCICLFLPIAPSFLFVKFLTLIHSDYFVCICIHLLAAWVFLPFPLCMFCIFA